MTDDDLVPEAEAQARELAALVVARASISEVDALKAANAQLILKVAEHAQSQHSASAWKKAGDELRALLIGRDRSEPSATSESAGARRASLPSAGESPRN